MSFSGKRTSEGALKMLMTKALFDQESWLIGVFVCSFVFVWNMEGCVIQIISNNPFCAVCELHTVLSTLGEEVGYSMLLSKSWLWWLYGYWKGRFLNWKAWLQKLCTSSHFASQTCLKMFPFHKCTITCKLLIAQAARAVTIQCHWWQLLPYKMCWEVCFMKSTRSGGAFLGITWSCLLYFFPWGRIMTALNVF